MSNPVTALMPNFSFLGTDLIAKNESSELPSANLTPETLLLYCSSRLGSLDEQIQSIMKEQDRSGTRAAQLTKLIAAANRPSVGNVSEIRTKPGTAEREAVKANELLDVYRNSDDPAVLEKAAAEFRITTGRDVTEFPEGTVISADNMKFYSWGMSGDNETDKSKRLDTYKNELSVLNNGAEMKMIELQGLISKRQLAVQLTTQGLQTLNETHKTIAGNIGR